MNGSGARQGHMTPAALYIEAARRSAPGSSGMAWRRPIPCRLVTHHLTTLDPITVEPGQCPTQEADQPIALPLLLICQHLDRGEPCGVVDGHVDQVASDASRAPLLPIACDAVSNLAEAGQLIDVDVNQFAGPFPFVALHRRLWIKVSQPAQA